MVLYHNEIFVYWNIWNKPWSAFFCRLCAWDINEHMDIFLDIHTTKDAVIQAGTAIFHYIHQGPGTTLGAILYNMFSRKAAAGLIKPETLPPTEAAAAQHSLCLPTDPGLDPSTEHVSGPQWLWMDISCPWLWTSSNSIPNGFWGATLAHKLQL